MRTHFKKLLSSLLALVMVLSLMPVSVFAADIPAEEESLSEAELLASGKYLLQVFRGQADVSDPNPKPNVEIIEYAVAPGQVVTLTPNPAPDGQVFNTWFTEPSSVKVPFTLDDQGRFTFKMPARSLKVLANYAQPGFFNVNTTGCEAFSLGADGSESPIFSAVTGQTVYLRADSRYGKVFDHWETDDFRVQIRDSGNGPCFVMPHGHVHITAVYADDPNMFPVTVEGGFLLDVPEAEGQPTKAPYNPGDTVRLLPAPAPEGQEFKGWTADPADLTITKTGGAYQFTMPGQAVTLTAGYGAPDQLLGAVDVSVAVPVSGQTPEEASADSAGFSIAETSWSPTAESFLAGEVYTVHIVLTAQEGHSFSPDTVFTLNGQILVPETAPQTGDRGVTLSYTFPAAPAIHDILVTGGQAFVYSPSHEKIYITFAAAGQEIGLEATVPDTDQRFDFWSADGEDVAFSSADAAESSFVMPDRPVGITANFHTHTADGEGWHITPSRHWKVCTCGDVFAQGAHHWTDGPVDGVLRCSDCGYLSIQSKHPSDNTASVDRSSFYSAAALQKDAVTFPIRLRGADGSRSEAFVTYDAAAVRTIMDAMVAGQASKLILTLEEVDFSQVALFSAAPDHVAAYRLTLSFEDGSGNTVLIDDLGSGTVSVSVPCPPVGTQSIVVNRAEEDGSLAQIQSSYSKEENSLTWISSRHGLFTISTVNYYGYGQLRGSEAMAYNLVAAAVSARIPALDLSSCGLNLSQVSKVLELVQYDHPEYYFWMNTDVSVSQRLTFSYREADPETHQAFLQATAQLLSAAQGLTTDAEKALALHDALVSHVSYQHKTPSFDDHTALGALVGGSAVSDGYARAYQHLLHQLGIQSYLVTGTVSIDGAAPVPHSWNLVRLDGKYYYTDAARDDFSSKNEASGHIFHAYLNVPEQWLGASSIRDSYGVLPECTDDSLIYGGMLPMGEPTMETVYKALTPVDDNSVEGRFFYTGSGDENTLFSWLRSNWFNLGKDWLKADGNYSKEILCCGRETYFYFNASNGIKNMPNQKPAYRGSVPTIYSVDFDPVSDQLVVSTAPIPEGEILEYGMTTTNSADGVKEWQDSNSFPIPDHSGTFYFVARVKENEEHRASNPTQPKAHVFYAPVWATFLSSEQNSVTLKLRNKSAGTLTAAVYDESGRMLTFLAQGVASHRGELTLTFDGVEDLSLCTVKVFLLDAYGAPTQTAVEYTAKP